MIKEVNEKAVTDLISIILSNKKIMPHYEEKLLKNVSSYDHKIPFTYKKIHYNGSPLFATVLTKKHNLLEKILRNGASVDYPEKDGGTPLMQAAYLGDAKAFQILLNAGANINARDNYKLTVQDHANNCPLEDANPVLQYFEDQAENGLEEKDIKETNSENQSNFSIVFYNPLFNQEI